MFGKGNGTPQVPQPSAQLHMGPDDKYVVVTVRANTRELQVIANPNQAMIETAMMLAGASQAVLAGMAPEEMKKKSSILQPFAPPERIV